MLFRIYSIFNRFLKTSSLSEDSPVVASHPSQLSVSRNHFPFSGRVGKDSLMDITPFCNSEYRLHMALLSPAPTHLRDTIGFSILGVLVFYKTLKFSFR